MKHKGVTHPDALVALGPLVSVTLTPSPTMLVHGYPVPRASIMMMIDTGAQSTVIEDRIAVAMGLVPTRQQNMVGVSGKPELCPVYPIVITIGFADGSGNMATADFGCDAIGMNSPPHQTAHQGLIGRDFLKHFELHYNGPTGTFDVIIPREAAAAVTPPKPRLPQELTQAQRQDKKDKKKATEKAKRKNRR